jgi:ElaB/YqjD/DUF883 family membrane-anchored ribosome-binding protein
MAERADAITPIDYEATEPEERSVEEIRNDIAARRAAIATTVDRLGDKVEQTLDWRTYVNEHPMVALGIAAGVGMLAGRLFKPRPSPRQRILDAFADTMDDMRGQVRSVINQSTERRPGLGGAVKAAATAMVTKAAADYLQARFIGQEHDVNEEHPAINDEPRERATNDGPPFRIA